MASFLLTAHISLLEAGLVIVIIIIIITIIIITIIIIRTLSVMAQIINLPSSKWSIKREYFRNVVFKLGLSDLSVRKKLNWYKIKEKKIFPFLKHFSRSASEQDKSVCLVKGKSEASCQNYIKVRLVGLIII